MSFICIIITYILELHKPLLNGHPSMVLGVLRSSSSCPTSDAFWPHHHFAFSSIGGAIAPMHPGAPPWLRACSVHVTDPFLTSKIPYVVAQIGDRPISHRDNFSHQYLVRTSACNCSFVLCQLLPLLLMT